MSASRDQTADVRVCFVGWRELGEEDDGAGGEAGRRFQIIAEFEGAPPNWPVGWFLDGRFRLSR